MDSFASDLLHEVKVNSKRWFIAFCVMVIVEVATIFGFMWYITLPIEEVTRTEQTVDDIDASTITQIGGDNYGQSETDKDNL